MRCVISYIKQRFLSSLLVKFTSNFTGSTFQATAFNICHMALYGVIQEGLKHVLPSIDLQGKQILFLCNCFFRVAPSYPKTFCPSFSSLPGHSAWPPEAVWLFPA